MAGVLNGAAFGHDVVDAQRAYANVLRLATSGMTLDLVADICGQFAPVLGMSPDPDEKVGISTYSGRLIHNLERFAPALADKYVMAAYPDSSGQNKAVNHGYDWWMVMKTKNSDESMKFVKWFVKEKLIDLLPHRIDPQLLK